MSTLEQVIEKLKEISEALEDEWFRYTRLKKYERLTRLDLDRKSSTE